MNLATENHFVGIYLTGPFAQNELKQSKMVKSRRKHSKTVCHCLLNCQWYFEEVYLKNLNKYTPDSPCTIPNISTQLFQHEHRLLQNSLQLQQTTCRRSCGPGFSCLYWKKLIIFHLAVPFQWIHKTIQLIILPYFQLVVKSQTIGESSPWE